MNVYELNMDGLVGPSHHYAGLAAGNMASETNALTKANPLQAALQGIKKMRLLHNMGIKQALLPPHPRPNLELLYQLGFQGSPEQQVRKAKKIAPNLLSACYSASSMWTANAATISPSMDTADKRVHLTPANLITNLHRHQEAYFSGQLLKTVFSDASCFYHHPPLPSTLVLSDEGAANHNRLCSSYSHPGVNVFVFGKYGIASHRRLSTPIRYPARQTFEASAAIARRHQLNHERTLFVQQSPNAIDQGVFHNDVISTANENVFLVHEDAFLNQQSFIETLSLKADFPLHVIHVPSQQISVKEAVSSYLFNSQLITLPDKQAKKMALLAPLECKQQHNIKEFIDGILADDDNPIVRAHYLDLKQSMKNGGGPACLRLRIVLQEKELNAMHQGVIVSEALLNRIEAWIKRHYRTELHADDLDDKQLIDECFTALDELSSILNLGSIYSFQK